MFTLRRFSEEAETNIYLGDAYALVDRETHPEEFRRCYKKVFGKDHVADLDDEATECSKNCYRFVSGDDGRMLIPITRGPLAYIVSANGSTYANLTVR